jgi:hypothetical protein
MRVSLTWIALLLLSIAISILFYKGKKTYEAFTSEKTSEGFVNPITDDIQISTCPADSKSFIDNLGRTICCQGSVENGICTGKAICSLSESAKGLPTCSEWYSALLSERGRDRCPVSMPNYFEGGCTAGKRKADGSGPADPSIKFCKFYTTKDNDESKLDSCSNVKMMDETICFPSSSIPVSKRIVSIRKRSFLPAVIQCSYFNNNNAGNCYSDNSMKRLFQLEVDRGERSANYVRDLDPIYKFEWCSKHQKVAIDKTSTIDDLKYDNLDGTMSPRPTPVTPPPKIESPPVLKADVQPKPKVECRFNHVEYANMYPDLKAAFGYDQNKLKEHYKTYGLAEGRSPCGNLNSSCKFEDGIYYQLNPDVKAANVDAKLHYRTYGINEGRQVCLPK